MYCLTVTYPLVPGKRFDTGYYVETHIPLCARLFSPYGYYGHVLRLHGGSEPGKADAYLAEVDLYFESPDHLMRAMAEQGGAVAADVANYTDIEPQMRFADAAASLAKPGE